MVSGFFTSPYDHERIFSGDARPILIASNSSSCVTCLKRSSNAFIEFSDVRRGDDSPQRFFQVIASVNRRALPAIHGWFTPRKVGVHFSRVNLCPYPRRSQASEFP